MLGHVSGVKAMVLKIISSINIWQMFAMFISILWFSETIVAIERRRKNGETFM